MAYKNREESKELKILRSLNVRMELPAEEKTHYLNLKKGYEGEVQFDRLTEEGGLAKKFLILNDLLLKCGKTTFQIDTTIITRKTIILCEIKNIEGNYYFEDKNFYSCSTKTIITNPLEQLNRIKILLLKKLKKSQFNIPIDGHVVFINPEFYLYQAPLNDPTVFYTQLNQFLRTLNENPANLNGGHYNLAKYLAQQHITDSPYTQLPQYRYECLRKGKNCRQCLSFLVKVDNKVFACLQCGYRESVENGVLHIVEEIKLLFPEMKVTLNVVDEWCQSSIPKWTIRRVLQKHFRTMGHGQWTYYE
jgi:hypothetical protein